MYTRKISNTQDHQVVLVLKTICSSYEITVIGIISSVKAEFRNIEYYKYSRIISTDS